MSAVSEVVTLSDGKKVPSLAFGTYQVSTPCRPKCAHPVHSCPPGRSVRAGPVQVTTAVASWVDIPLEV